MSWQANATLDALMTFLGTIPGVQSVRKGEQTSWPNAVTVSVSIGAAPMNDRMTTGLVRRDLDIWVTFGYRVSNDAGQAETILADVLDEFQRRFLVERATDRLNQTVDSMELDTTPATAAEYRPIAGQEFRLYPVIVRVVQHHALS